MKIYIRFLIYMKMIYSLIELDYYFNHEIV